MTLCRAVPCWLRSASQSSDRWTTFTLKGLHVWQQDLGIMIQRFSHRIVRSNSESVEPRVHWRSQTWSLLESRPFSDYSVSIYESEWRNNIQCSLPLVCKLVAAYQGLHQSFHNGTPRRPQLPITLWSSWTYAMLQGPRQAAHWYPRRHPTSNPNLTIKRPAQIICLSHIAAPLLSSLQPPLPLCLAANYCIKRVVQCTMAFALTTPFHA